MANDAIRVNGNTAQGIAADIAITVRGSNWYWAVCALMTVATLVFYGMSFTRPRSHRLFHYIIASITLISAISYFTKASNLGWTAVPVQFVRSNPKVAGFLRQIFYVRYIDWFITTPLIILALLLTAAVPWSTILLTMFLAAVMVVTGLVGALVRTSYKWGYFTFGCAAMLAVLYHILWTGRKHTVALGADVSRTYTTAAGLQAFLWLLYPIAWGLSEGGNVIAPDSEGIFYGILDILSKVVFGALLLLGHKKIEPARLGLHLRDYDDLPRQTPIHEKLHHRNGVSDTTTTTTTVPVTGVTTSAV